jgi:hypothetical protein
MSSIIPYTDKEKEILKTMHGLGFTPADIAKVLKTRTIKQIQNYGYDLGLRWTKEPEIDIAAYKRMIKGK